jgi:hypothetical protein
MIVRPSHCRRSASKRPGCWSSRRALPTCVQSGTSGPRVTVLVLLTWKTCGITYPRVCSSTSATVDVYWGSNPSTSKGLIVPWTAPSYRLPLPSFML